MIILEDAEDDILLMMTLVVGLVTNKAGVLVADGLTLSKRKDGDTISLTRVQDNTDKIIVFESHLIGFSTAFVSQTAFDKYISHLRLSHSTALPTLREYVDKVASELPIFFEKEISQIPGFSFQLIICGIEDATPCLYTIRNNGSDVIKHVDRATIGDSLAEAFLETVPVQLDEDDLYNAGYGVIAQTAHFIKSNAPNAEQNIGGIVKGVKVRKTGTGKLEELGYIEINDNIKKYL